ncbi:MAG TPA: LytTR family DNA-binding domain-containing protein [Candidatus Polarisedimenticolia bacterium]|nr:LytTR family DNA-binding domain-containing protein [Candidatus Polarisedimenticolia bacterium]
MNAVVNPNELRIASFWRLQAAGWGCFCLLCALVVLPYVQQPGELGYQSSTGLFADQGLICLVGFLASLTLRPVCRSLLLRPFSWITLEVRAGSWCLVIGTSAAFMASRFIIAKLELVELLEACAKTAALLFLWCNLYFSIKQSQRRAQERELIPRVDGDALGQHTGKYASRFAVRTGARIQVVPAEALEWIAAAGDYSELRTRNGAHLLRETMNSLEQKLDPERFARIHRSRIVRLDQIVELRGIDNREYVVKLRDGTQHRSSRTYADRLETWLRSGQARLNSD